MVRPHPSLFPGCKHRETLTACLRSSFNFCTRLRIGRGRWSWRNPFDSAVGSYSNHLGVVYRTAGCLLDITWLS